MKALLWAHVLSSLMWFSIARNVSPLPNIILNTSESSSGSYFGYSLNLRNTHVMVGAPRANSSVSKGTGQVYKCNFEGLCEDFEMGQSINEKFSQRVNQSFGASMDGFGDENDIFVACAPRYEITNGKDLNDFNRMIGTCYYTKNTIKSEANNIFSPLQPLNEEKNFYIDRSKIGYSQKSFNESVSKNMNDLPYYIWGESGFSCHITDNKEEVLLGAPNVLTSVGMVNKHNFKTCTTTTPDLTIWDSGYRYLLGSDSFFGYAVTSGQFMPKDSKTIYVASAPKRNNISNKSSAEFGTVIFFEILPKDLDNKTYIYNKVHLVLRGTQMGSYFGYALIADDFNNDKGDDLVVSAPYYANPNSANNGIVYVYYNYNDKKKNKKKNKIVFKKREEIRSASSYGGERFGLALGKIGDINGDGFNDLAVSAQLSNKAMIYIYYGSNGGLKLGQKIEMSDTNFIMSISRGVDIDGNGFNDLAVGIPESDKVYIFKSYPVIRLFVDLKPSKPQVELNDTFEILACFNVSPRFQPKFAVAIKVDYQIDRRMSFQDPSKKHSTIEIPSKTQFCSNLIFNVNAMLKNETTMGNDSAPIKIRMKYYAAKEIPKETSEFCEDCVILASNPELTKEIPLNTGCNGSCKPDLKIVGSSNEHSENLVMGSLKTVTISFNISNSGDLAYFLKIRISIPPSFEFMTLPKLCKKIDHKRRELNATLPSLICNLKSGKPLKRDQSLKFEITLDIEKNRELSTNVTAKVLSGGDEVNYEDNKCLVPVNFKQQSSVEISSDVSEKYIVIKQNEQEEQEIKYKYEILNRGPSYIRNTTVEIYLPYLFIIHKNESIKIIEINSAERIYNEERVIVEKEEFHTKQIGIDSKNYTIGPDNNKTLIVDCSQSYVQCKSFMLSVEDFERSSENFIQIVVNFSVIKRNINKILNESIDLMIISPTLHLKPSHTVILAKAEIKHINIKREFQQTNWLIYVAASLGGSVCLLLIVFVLYKLGFFM